MPDVFEILPYQMWKLNAGYVIRDTRCAIDTAAHNTRCLRCKIRDTRCEMQYVRYEMRDARYEMQDARCKIRDTRYEHTRDEIRDAR